MNSFVTAQSYHASTFASGLLYLVRKDLLNDEQCQLIANALVKFDAITAPDDRDDEVNFMNKLTMRRLTSFLARALYEWFKRENKLIPESVMYWKSISEDPEEFAEIRLAWE